MATRRSPRATGKSSSATAGGTTCPAKAAATSRSPRFVVRHLAVAPAAARILDVGCGEGPLLEPLRQLGVGRYLGIDVAETVIERAQKLADRNTRFLAADAESYTTDERFDAIVFNESLYYFEDPLPGLGTSPASSLPAGSSVSRCSNRAVRSPSFANCTGVSRPSKPLHLPPWRQLVLRPANSSRPAGEPMTEFGRAFRSHWAIDPDLTYLNHGTVGAPPRRVLEAQRALIEEIERQPATFMLRDLTEERGAGAGRAVPHMREAAAVVAEFLGARAADLVFVDNATTGANAVLRSLPLGPGDEILVTDHGYGGVVNTARYVARERGARLTTLALPFPVSDPAEILGRDRIRHRLERRPVGGGVTRLPNPRRRPHQRRAPRSSSRCARSSRRVTRAVSRSRSTAPTRRERSTSTFRASAPTGISPTFTSGCGRRAVRAFSGRRRNASADCIRWSSPGVSTAASATNSISSELATRHLTSRRRRRSH